MRNGNPNKFVVAVSTAKFLSYLWGMETEMWLRYFFNNVRSYPTYEEWKQFLRLKIFIVWLSSYPTYEEWKLFFITLIMCYSKSFLSYLWGMETTFDFCHILDNSRVLILPMRNGNEDSARRSAAGWVGVLILPMRNGNVLALTKYVPSSCSFLSYLWGMETICLISIINLFTWFLSYLWGMETILTNRRLMGDRQFLSYLWGMETHL